MAHSYSSLFNLPTSGTRFFTVYGPGADLIKHYLFSQKILLKIKKLIYSILGNILETLHISMT